MRRLCFSILNNYVFEYEFVEVDGLGKVARDKAHGVEFRVIEDMRFQQHGRGDIEPLADIRKVLEKFCVRELIVPFVRELVFDFSVFDYLGPNSEHIKILL